MRVMVLALTVLLQASAPVQGRPQDLPLPDLDTFTTQVKKRLATNEEQQSEYTFREKRTEQKLDGAGRPKDQTVKVFEVYPGLPGEDRYRRLIEEDGKPVPEGKLADGDRARLKKAEEYAKRIATGPAAQKEAREREKERAEVRAAVDDLFRLYDIQLVRRETIDGAATILATLTPKSGARPQTDSGKMMQHFKARAWISESDYELVRVEAEAIDTLSFGMGLLARIHKGTTATFQRHKVNDETWLPQRVTWTASARVLLVKQMRLQGVSDFYDYRKFTVGTSTTYKPEK